MRVIGGKAGGMVLRSPLAAGVRPTTDRVRGALFNILTAYGLEGVRVADLYAGTGALGIEALSRGASQADFVEIDSRQIEVIRANLRHTRTEERSVVLHADVQKAIRRLGGFYDYILMDPPYTQPFPRQIVEELGRTKGLLTDHAIIVVGHSSRVKAPVICGKLERWRDERYGDATLAFYQLKSEGQS